MATFANQATLTYSGGTAVSNIASGEVLDVLSVSKTAVIASYEPGDVVTYVVGLVNTGTAALTGLTLTDDLGAYTFGGSTRYPLTYEAGSVKYYVNGELQTAPTVTAGPPLTVSGLSIPAGGNATVIYAARLNEYAPPEIEGTVNNTATLTGGGVNQTSAQATINARTGPRLSITKSAAPSVVSDNGQLTFTFLIQNYGSTAADAGDNIVLTDNMDPILSNISVTFNGTAWSSPANYSYNESTGLFSTVAGQITVPAASYTQDAATGVWSTSPGTSTLVVTGTV